MRKMTDKLTRLIIISSLGIVVAAKIWAVKKNGFELSGSLIEQSKIVSGGPPRDGIPSIDRPRFIPVSRVDYLRDNDIVIGIVRGKIAKAYPTRILVWHEIVNDRIGSAPVVITYCPLCATGMVFDRKVGNRVRTFGVSGLLYNSNVLMYDRESQSLWSQLAMKAVTGPLIGTKLKWVASEHSTWASWKRRYPFGQVMSLQTGYRRHYQAAGPYQSYVASSKLMFPVPLTRGELANKALVIGVVIKGKAKAYAIDGLLSGHRIKDTLGSTQISVQYDRDSKRHRVVDSQGRQIPSVLVFWFAWQAFYPQTGLRK